LVKDLTIQILHHKVEFLTRKLAQVEKNNKFLLDENAALKSENASLQARLDSNSQNSNKPPSSDGYKKKTVQPAFPKAKGKKQGGQKGHKGHTMQQVSAPDIIVP
jgi:regulator of replication initiation timing